MGCLVWRCSGGGGGALLQALPPLASGKPGTQAAAGGSFSVEIAVRLKEEAICVRVKGGV